MPARADIIASSPASAEVACRRTLERFRDLVTVAPHSTLAGFDLGLRDRRRRARRLDLGLSQPETSLAAAFAYAVGRDGTESERAALWTLLAA
jgi:hypothetical protein